MFPIVLVLLIILGAKEIAETLQHQPSEQRTAQLTGKIVGIALRYFLYYLTFVYVVKGLMLITLKKFLSVALYLFIANIFIYFFVFWLTGPKDLGVGLEPEVLKFFLAYLLLSFLVWLVNVENYHQYQCKRENPALPKEKITKYLLRSLFFSVMVLYVLVGLNQYFVYKVFYFNWFSVSVVLVVTLFFIGLFYYIEEKKYRLVEKAEQESQRAEQITAQYEGLKNQIDPHFLFNSLNVLNSLIEENPTKATEFTNDLAQIYRYVLEHKNLDKVSVTEEIEFAQKYINLLQIRYEDNLQVQLDSSAFIAQETIVPLALQLLLENAIKHNNASTNKPLRLSIYRENDYLVVKNSLQPKDNTEDSTKIGLKNIENRYRFLTDKKVVIDQNLTDFWVKIPLLS